MRHEQKDKRCPEQRRIGVNKMFSVKDVQQRRINYMYSVSPENTTIKKRIESERTATESNTGQTRTQKHGSSRSQMTPFRHIITRPNSTIPLRPRKKSTRQNKRTMRRRTCGSRRCSRWQIGRTPHTVNRTTDVCTIRCAMLQSGKKEGKVPASCRIDCARPDVPTRHGAGCL
jgi:hypothetical protein